MQVVKYNIFNYTCIFNCLFGELAIWLVVCNIYRFQKGR